jgi:hypothetical protein
MTDLAEMRKHASEAVHASSLWLYQRHYASGARVISCREPTSHTISLTSVHSWEYARVAGVSSRTALSHLRKLVSAGWLQEIDRRSTACRFKPSDEVSRHIGDLLIGELRAKGLPFEDEWREAGSPKVWPPSGTDEGASA